MKQLAEMTARELNSMYRPTRDMMIDAVELLIERGWRWQWSSACPAHVKNPYAYGWWINESHPTKNRPVGDPGNMHQKAWDALRLYEAE